MDSTKAPGPMDLASWRLQILDRVLSWTAVVGLLPCAAGVGLAVLYGLWPVVALDLICWGAVAVVAWNRNLSYSIRSFTAIAVFSSLGIGVLAATGPYGVGLLWLLAVPVLTGLLAPTKMMWFAQGVVFIALLSILVLSWRGFLLWPGPPAPLLWWVMAWTSLLCISLMVGLSASKVTEGLQHSLHAVQIEREALAKANEALVIEIDARRRVEQDREMLQRQLLLSQKMEAIGQLAGGFAHDLNNVLTVIRLEVGLVHSLLPQRDDLSESLDNALTATDSAAALCGRLLMFARKRPSGRVVVDIDRAIRAFEPLLSRLVGGHSQLVVTLAAEGALVDVDPVEFEQLLANLVTNARDAMPKGGQIELSTHTIVGERGMMLLLEVTDEGIGMDEATLARIFEPFFTTKPEGSGTGLGLSTVYAIVNALGGEITIDSAPGRGSHFHVQLPITERDAPTISMPVLPAMRMPTKPPRVLVAEDQPAVRAVIERVLYRLGCEVSSVSSGGEVLSWLERCPELPDLLLTDMVMPGVTGADLAEQALARHPHLKILAMSGYLRSGDLAVRIAKLGIPLLHKPFTPDDLARAVAEKLAKRAM